MRQSSLEQQVRFFTNLQHLLTEGEFVSTYKFALLIALTRWALENPDHDEAVPLDASALAPHFAELYWPHVLPFESGRMLESAAEPRATFGSQGDPAWQGVLVQDRGGQVPRVLKLIMQQYQRGHTRLRDLSGQSRERLLIEVKNSIKAMPLWKLHSVGGTSDFRFLYHRGDGDQWLVFEPGIVSCLASFAMLVEQVVRSAWLRFVLRCNPHLLGNASQVEDFLFPEGRAGLAVWRPVLQELQGSQCFYCRKPMTNDGEVDHFLPWSRYPRDLGQNFVLAHAMCNQDKKDHLASCEHLEDWCRRNEEHSDLLARRFDESRLPHDWQTLRRVASSLYHIAATSNARVWHATHEMVPLSPDWRRILGVA